MEAPVNEIRKASLLHKGKSQVIEVPSGFELPGTEVNIIKDGGRLIIEPRDAPLKDSRRLAELLDSWDNLDLDWPDVDEGLLPPDDINL
jgi:antitoxin VapB